MVKSSSEFVDVIVPNYNKKAYIEECLQSLLNQTHRNWRCIFIDGFSDDGSWEIIQDLAKQDARFELYQVPKTGCYQAWNLGLEKVINPYFCILTSDDIWPENWLHTALDSLANHKDAICAVARTALIQQNGQCGQIAGLGERLFINDDFSPRVRNGVIDSMAAYFLGPIYTSIHSLLMRSEVLKQGVWFAEDVGAVADWEWYLRMGLLGNIIYHPEITVLWRVYSGQFSDARQQEEHGQFIQKIHLRNRHLIAERLGDYGEEFNVLAERYDREILAYHYGRPCLANVYARPVSEFFKLLKISSTMPKQMFMDLLLKFVGKSFYVEETLSLARKAINGYKI